MPLDLVNAAKERDLNTLCLVVTLLYVCALGLLVSVVTRVWTPSNIIFLIFIVLLNIFGVFLR